MKTSKRRATKMVRAYGRQCGKTIRMRNQMIQAGVSPDAYRAHDDTLRDGLGPYPIQFACNAANSSDHHVDVIIDEQFNHLPIPFADHAHPEMLLIDESDVVERPAIFGMRLGLFRLEAKHFTREWRAKYALGPGLWGDTAQLLAEFAHTARAHVPIDAQIVIVNLEDAPLDGSHPDKQAWFANWMKQSGYVMGDSDAQIAAYAEYHREVAEFFPTTCREIRKIAPKARVGWYGMLPKWSADEPKKRDAALASIDRMRWFYDWTYGDGPDFVSPNCYIMNADLHRVGVHIGDRLDDLMKQYRIFANEVASVRGIGHVDLIAYTSSNYAGDSTNAGRMFQDVFHRYVGQVASYADELIHFGGPGRDDEDMTPITYRTHLEQTVRPTFALPTIP